MTNSEDEPQSWKLVLTLYDLNEDTLSPSIINIIQIQLFSGHYDAKLLGPLNLSVDPFFLSILFLFVLHGKTLV